MASITDFPATSAALDSEIEAARAATSHGGSELTGREREILASGASVMVDAEGPTLTANAKKLVVKNLIDAALERHNLPLEAPSPSVWSKVTVPSPLVAEIDALTTGVKAGADAFDNPANLRSLQAIVDATPAYIRNIGFTWTGTWYARQNVKALNRLITELEDYPYNPSAHQWLTRVTTVRDRLQEKLG